MDDTRQPNGYDTGHDNSTDGNGQTQGHDDGLHATLNLWTGRYVPPELCEQMNSRRYPPSIPSARALFPQEFRPPTTRGARGSSPDAQDQASASAKAVPTIPPLNDLLDSVMHHKLSRGPSADASKASDLNANRESGQVVSGSSSRGKGVRSRRSSVSEKWVCPHCGYPEAHASTPRSQCALCDRCGTVWIMDEYRNVDARKSIF